MSAPFVPNATISASDFMTKLVSFYNDYWSDPESGMNGETYPFQFDSNHNHPNSPRRKGWGQDPVKVKGTTATSVATGQLIEREHLNTVAAQVNAGMYHINNDFLYPVNASYNGLETRPLPNNVLNLVNYICTFKVVS